MASMHIVDYIIFIGTMVLSFGIGVYFACRKVNTSPESYLLANRKMNIAPIATSLLVSFISAISLLGNSSEMYYYGASYYFMVIGWSLSLVTLSVTMVPLIHPLKLVSLHQYFMMRYKVKGLVYVGTFCQTMAASFVNGIVIFGPAIMLESMAGLPVWAGMLVLGLVSTIYTTIGGFQAVIWSDVFQAVVMFLGLILINILGTIEIGGIKEVWQIYYDHGRLDLKWDASPFVRSTVWGFIIGMFVNVNCFFGVSQISVQRFCSLPTVRDAQRSVWYSIPGLILIVTLTCSSGVVAFSYFAKIGCDPLMSGQIHNKNQVLPFLIVDVLNYPGVPGIFMACILCGSFSNLSSSYNSLSALIWDDVLKDLLASRNLSEMEKTLVTKIIAFSAGISAILTGFFIAQLGGTLIQISMGIAAIAFLPLNIFMILGATSTRSSWKSATIGALLPSCFIAWINFGSNLSGHIHNHLPTVTTNCSTILMEGNYTAMAASNVSYLSEYISTSSPGQESSDSEPVFILYKMFYMWYSPIGLIVGLGIGLILSYVPGFRNTEKLDTKLLFPFIRKIVAKADYLPYSEEKLGTYAMNDANGVSHSDTLLHN